MNDYQRITTDVEDLKVFFDLYDEGEVTNEELTLQYEKALNSIEEIELKNMLSTEEDILEAYLKINAGAGGTESQDWAEMLMRMYIRWGERNNYSVREVSMLRGEEAGIKTVTLEFSGEYAYGYLKSETGVHRLVRISPFDSNQRRHTSFASVFVSPVIDDTIEIIENSGYFPNTAWQFGNQFNAYYIKGQEKGIWEETIALNESALRAPTLGFNFDQEPISHLIAQQASIVEEYVPALTTGSLDPDTYLPEFIDKLGKADSEREIMAEIQRQLDEWKNK